MAHPSTLQKNGSKFAFCLNFFARYSKMTVQVIKATGIKKSLVQKKKLAKTKTYIFLLRHQVYPFICNKIALFSLYNITWRLAMVVLDELFILLNTTLKLKKKRQPLATRFHFSAPLLHLDSLPTEA